MIGEWQLFIVSFPLCPIVFLLPPFHNQDEPAHPANKYDKPDKPWDLWGIL